MAKEHDLNLDPITKAPGSHPVGTGLGAVAGGAAAGAAAGVIAGPVGALAGAVVGAVVGGLGGKAVAEAVNPTAEEAYWKENYNSEPYYEAGRSYDDYAPAYGLGLQGRTSYQGSFDETEDRLASDWESKKDHSSLSWPQAREASRAAWNRVDQQTNTFEQAPVQTGRANMSASSEIDNDEVVDTLNDLLESCRDGEYGFRECAEHAEAADLKSLFMRHADQCRTAGMELMDKIRQLGGDADEGGTTMGAMHRGWVSVRGTLAGYSDQAMLDECERGEDAALARYRKALKQDLPQDIRSLVERQTEGTQRNHDQIKALRDANQRT